MDLPEIPAAAVDASRHVSDAYTARRVLEIAWPFLYAAALRGAASEFIVRGCFDSDHDRALVAAILSEWADEYALEELRPEHADVLPE